MKKGLLILSVVLLFGSGLRAMEGDGSGGFGKFDVKMETLEDLKKVKLETLQKAAFVSVNNYIRIDGDLKEHFSVCEEIDQGYKKEDWKLFV